MTRQECSKLLVAMMAIYTDRYPDPEGSLRRMLPGWHMVLEEYDYAEANQGLMWYARTDRKGFPPVPGQIIEGIVQARQVRMDGQIMDEADAWKICYKAMCDSAYHSEEQYAKLPPIIQRAVGSPAILRQMALEENISVTRGQFARAFQQAQARQGKEETMPADVKELAAKTAERIQREKEEKTSYYRQLVEGLWEGAEKGEPQRLELLSAFPIPRTSDQGAEG